MDTDDNTLEKHDKSYITRDVWLDLQKKESAELNESFEETQKSRRKREMTLVIMCLLALIYTYPVNVKNLKSDQNIEIPAISLKLPLKDAINFFPTLIASIYLIFISSVVSHFSIMHRRAKVSKALEDFKETGKIPPKGGSTNFRSLSLRLLFLPTPLHPSIGDYPEAAALSKTIVDIFVGLVFTLLPYFAAVFILIKSYIIKSNIPLFIWNWICAVIMLFSFISAILEMQKKTRF